MVFCGSVDRYIANSITSVACVARNADNGKGKAGVPASMSRICLSRIKRHPVSKHGGVAPPCTGS